MLKNLQRRKPGFTKTGKVKIVCLNYTQLAEQLAANSKKKIQSKIRNRMHILAQRQGFAAPSDPHTI